MIAPRFRSRTSYKNFTDFRPQIRTTLRPRDWCGQAKAFKVFTITNLVLCLFLAGLGLFHIANQRWKDENDAVDIEPGGAKSKADDADKSDSVILEDWNTGDGDGETGGEKEEAAAPAGSKKDGMLPCG